MAFLAQLKQAAEIYMNLAFPALEPPPEAFPDLNALAKPKLRELALKRVDELMALTTAQALREWPYLEQDGKKFAIRLGNLWYPHMKLTFRLVDRIPVFYIDCHDQIDPNLTSNPTGLRQLQAYNRLLRKMIERNYHQQGLVTQGEIIRRQIRFPPKLIPKSCHILAVDDDVHVCEVMETLGKRLGFRVSRAQSVAEAIHILEGAEPIHLIFCDIVMEGAFGYELLAFLRRTHRNIPFYFVTGLSPDKVEDTSVPIIQKPFQAQDITEALKAIASLPC
jgi:CheY-like chemotaxis protein